MSSGDAGTEGFTPKFYIFETKITVRGSRRRTTVPKYVFDTLKLNGKSKLRWIVKEGEPDKIELEVVV